MATRIVSPASRVTDRSLHVSAWGLVEAQGEQRLDQGSTTFDLHWLANWIRKLDEERGIRTGRLAELCQVQSQRISQLKDPDRYATPPSYELMWRLMAVLHEEEDWAGVSDETIRAILFRVMVSLGPSRLLTLASVSSIEARSMVDEGERKRSARQRLESIRTAPPDEPEKM